MDLVCIDFIAGIALQENGLMVRAMESGCRAALMGVLITVNSSVE